MDLATLTQFNPKMFKKLLGIYVKRRREELNITFEQLADPLDLTTKDVKLIESGQGKLNQNILNLLSYYLQFESSELENICRVTQIQSILEVYEVLYEHYPKQ
jgi:ribosome-binding protein aMBF1 (putative translation factor)